MRAALLVLAACGRLGFEPAPTESTTTDDSGTGDDAMQTDAMRPDVMPAACTASTCPAPATCMAGVCTFQCNLFNCDNVECPPGMPCDVQCMGNLVMPVCTGMVDCGDATACTVTCSGLGSCSGSIRCGTGKCDVTCASGACSGSVDCSDACECDVTCNACTNVMCPMGCTDGNGCTSAGACDQC
jgi:hypothetical protein